MHVGHTQAAFELDANDVTAKAMPQLTLVHIKQNLFEKLRVNLAFQPFTSDVFRELLVFCTALERQHEDYCEAAFHAD